MPSLNLPILEPRAFLDWDVIQRGHVIAHELGHVFVRHMHAFAIAQGLVPDGLYSSHGLAHGTFALGLAQGLSHGLSHGIARPGAQVSEHRQLHERLCAKSNVRGNLWR